MDFKDLDRANEIANVVKKINDVILGKNEDPCLAPADFVDSDIVFLARTFGKQFVSMLLEEERKLLEEFEKL
jgi:hypothetical protein